MGKSKYFFGIEVVDKKHWLLLSQRKYAFDLLEKTGLLEYKPASTPMKTNVDLCCDDCHIFVIPVLGICARIRVQIFRFYFSTFFVFFLLVLLLLLFWYQI